MRLEFTVWPFKWEEPYDGAIRRIRGLGFRAVELIGWKPETLDTYYTSRTIQELRSVLDGEGMMLSQFVANPGELASNDAAIRAKAIENLKRFSDVGVELGTKIVNTVTHYPFAIQYPPLIHRMTTQDFTSTCLAISTGSRTGWITLTPFVSAPVRRVGRSEVQPRDAPVPLRRDD